MDKPIRIVNTLLFSPKAKHVISRLNNVFRKKWSSSQMNRTATKFMYAETAPDNEIVIPLHYVGSGSVWSKSNDEILKWTAIHLKLAVKDSHPWFRANDEVVNCLSDDTFKVTVSDVYLIYDLWLGRKNIDMKYSRSQIKELIGERADPVTAEIELARRQEIEEIINQASAAVDAARDRMVDDINDFKSRREAEYNNERIQIEEERDAKIKKLNECVSGQLAS